MLDIYAISPVGSDPDYANKRMALEDSALRLGFNVLFPMDAVRQKLDSAPHIRQAMAQMTSAHIVVADLSLERPSCYFELGVAEASGANIAVIARRGTDIHQTSMRDLVQSYSDLNDYNRLVTRILTDVKRRVLLQQ